MSAASPNDVTGVEHRHARMPINENAAMVWPQPSAELVEVGPVTEQRQAGDTQQDSRADTLQLQPSIYQPGTTAPVKRGRRRRHPLVGGGGLIVVLLAL